MSILVEHDYIGSSSEVPPMENSDKSFSSGGLNLKATELRLGLPGSESPESKNGISQLSIGLSDNNNYSSSNSKSLMSGAKRGFSVAIHGGSGNWVFSGGAGSESDFSPAAANVGKMITGSGSGSDSGSVQDGLAQFPKPVAQVAGVGHGVPAASKAHVVGWPPIRSFRKNTMASNPPKNDDDAEAKLGSECLYIKVSMDGAPYLRKVDLKTYASYMELSSALEKMFSCFTIGQCSSNVVTSHHGLSESRLMDLLHGSEYVLTYEDKDGDWMLVGDVPWKMFTETCRRLRIMKSSDAVGLAPRAMEKSKSCN